MQATVDKPHSLITTHDAVASLLATVGPETLHQMRAGALERYTAVGLPTHKDEEFKYTSFRAVAETEFVPAYGATVEAEDLASHPIAALTGPRLTFVNGEYAPELSELNGLPREMTVSSLAQALEVQPGRVMAHLGQIASLEGRLGSTNDERFLNLNTAFIQDGAFVWIPKGVEMEQPLHLLFINRADHGAFAAHPRVLIVADEGCRAKVVESHIGLGGTYLSNVVTELAIAARAHVEHVRIQMESDDAFHVGWVAARQEADSVWSSNVASFGASLSRVDVNVFVAGEHTETWLNGASMGSGTQLMDHHTRIDHAQPNCNSFEVYKTVLAGRSHGVFNGKIFVYEDAQKTDAKQTNQALLLSKTAEIDTKPQLEIFADDVKCTHGATVGQLREDALFYLRSRGIPLAEARALLVYAFVAEVIEKISVEPVRELMEQVLFQKLVQAGSALEA